MRDTLEQLAEYHYVSLSCIKRMKSSGVDVSDHLEIEDCIMGNQRRPAAWLNGNPNRDDVQFPVSSKLPERDSLICYCDKGEKGYECIACRADMDFGCKYFWRGYGGG